MKQLLVKEFKLTGHPLSFFFLAFSAMTMIPGYPILVGSFFISLGIFYTFQFAREYNDVLYTALLPVKKSDVVKARYLFVVTLQLIGYFLCLLQTLLRMFLLSDAAPYVNNPMMNANFVYLGGYLLVMASFNFVFVKGFFKTAYAFGKPFILFSIVSFLIIGVMETLHHLPGLTKLNTCGFDYLGLQVTILSICAILYVVSIVVSLKKSMKSFEKIDL